MLKEIIAVFVGGGLGSVLRFLVNKIEIISYQLAQFYTD